MTKTEIYFAEISALISLVALVVNIILSVKARHEREIAKEQQLTDHFLRIDDLIIKSPNLSKAYITSDKHSNVFSKYDKKMVAFAYKHLNIFALVYEVYFFKLSEKQVEKKIKKNMRAKHWYDFIGRTLNTNSLLKQIIVEIIASNSSTKDYSKYFQRFLRDCYE